MSEISIALNRFGYGLKRGETAPLDARAYLLRQLKEFDPRPGALGSRPDTSGEAASLTRTLRSAFKSMREKAAAKAGGSDQSPPKMSREERISALPPALRTKAREAYGRLQADTAMRIEIAIASPNPFAERLVHFWSNHFTVTSQKGGARFEVGNHEFNAIRPHVTGRFSDLLKAAVLHPAMLIYLDQFQSAGPNSRFGKTRRGRRGLNENLAREILELHTLGVDGGYSQADVTEFARALTGWTVSGMARVKFAAEPQAGGAGFIAAAHEPGDRKVLGRTYADTGAKQAIAILDDLATHPSTARFVATKLARHFCADDPPPSLVARLERDFLRSGGDLNSLAQTLVQSPEPWQSEHVKFRQPFEWFIAAMRFTGVDDLPARRANGVLRALGQMPWQAPSPAGFDDHASSWAGPEALLRRVELAEQIARQVPADDILNRAENAFPDALSDHTRDWLSRAESGRQALALMLIAPEMLRR
ncbi:MAG: DUF1800 domain-containing protein [Pseudomonadota bacterium]|nr:DUF1800 domain-containing protein [Pseudomonadota bacterium]